jgi:biotin carboxyl carrier protein
VGEHDKFSEIALENGVFETRLTKKFARRKRYQKVDPRVIKAVIPGSVSEICKRVGDIVRQGETLLVLDAMKMLNRILAPHDGKVKFLRVAKGDKVSKGQVLIELD